MTICTCPTSQNLTFIGGNCVWFSIVVRSLNINGIRVKLSLVDPLNVLKEKNIHSLYVFSTEVVSLLLTFVWRLIELDKEDLLVDEKNIQDHKELGQSALIGCNFEANTETESFTVGIRLLSLNCDSRVNQLKSRIIPFFAYCIDLIENAVDIFHIYSKTADCSYYDDLPLAVYFHQIVIRFRHCFNSMSTFEYR